MDVLDIPLPIGPPAEANLVSLSGPSEEIVVQPDILLEVVHAEPEVEEGPVQDLLEAPQPQLVVSAEVHDPPAAARTPPPSPAIDVVGSPAPADPAPGVLECVVISDEEESVAVDDPIIDLADSPPPAVDPVVIDLVAAPATSAFRTPPIRPVPRRPPPLPRASTGPRCFNCQRRGHLGKYCPYPPAVGRPCFQCGLQGHTIAQCPTPAPFAADNRIRQLEQQQQLQAAQLRRLRTRRQLFSPPYSYAHQQLPPVAMWLGPHYPYQPPAPLGWAYQVPRWQVPLPQPAIAYPPPPDPEFSDPEGMILIYLSLFMSYLGLAPLVKSKLHFWLYPKVL